MQNYFSTDQKVSENKSLFKKILEECLNMFGFHPSSWQSKSKHTAGHIFWFVSMCVSHAFVDPTDRQLFPLPLHYPQNVFQTALWQSGWRSHLMDGYFTHLSLDS